VINLPTVSSGYSELYCWSGAVSGRCRKRWSGSGVDPIYRNRLERGAAFSPLTIRSHAVVVGSGKKTPQMCKTATY